MADLLDIVQEIGELRGEIVSAIKSLEKTIQSRPTYAHAVFRWLWVGLVIFGLVGLVGDAWNSKFMLAARYGAPTANITIEDEPHDCDFMRAPLGEKGCSYSKRVTSSTVTYGHDTNTNRPIVSYDDGKTWSWSDGYTGLFGQSRYVVVSWEKKE
jgi:hypothetical protein